VNLLVDALMVLVGLVVLLACWQARVNARVTRRKGFVIGGPETRIDREDDA
jgi:hypothetical protein